MIKSVRIENLRSLKDTGFVNIKPLTLLLGVNSSGKSTFLRSFPLFTQSIRKNLRGPISWVDESLVDFGDYQTSLNKEAKDNGENIRFSYILSDIDTAENFQLYKKTFGAYNFPIPDLQGFNLEVSISFKDDKNGTFVNEISVYDGRNTYKCSIENRDSDVDISIDGESIETEQQYSWVYSLRNKVLPTFCIDVTDKNDGKVLLHKAYDFICDYLNQRGGADKKLLPQLLFAASKKKKDILNFIANDFELSAFKEYVNKKGWTEDSEEFNTLYKYLKLYSLAKYIDVINADVVFLYSSCSYVAPARAEANRFYRLQGLQVEDIDPYGKNLQEFIASLSPKALKSYQDYTLKVLGVKVKVKSENGHQSILVSTENGEYNIADVGFGYSQILPIVTKLWFLSNKESVVKGATFIDDEVFLVRKSELQVALIEQPELHLHPAFQAKIADSFVNAINTSTLPLMLIAETHSDTIVNRIGRRIREGKIKKEDVNVVIFDKTDVDSNTVVRQLSFNGNGQIPDWPIGFFEPED